MRECFPGLRELVWAGVKMSLWREFVAVATANLAQRESRLALSRYRPSSASWSVREEAQYPTMAAMATLWLLFRLLDWATVRLECHTGQAISRWTRPSDFQYYIEA